MTPSPVVHWVLHLPATREVAGSSPAVAHLTAKSHDAAHQIKVWVLCTQYRVKSSKLQLPVPKGGLTPLHGYFPLSNPQDEIDRSRLAETLKKKTGEHGNVEMSEGYGGYKCRKVRGLTRSLVVHHVSRALYCLGHRRQRPAGFSQ